MRGNRRPNERPLRIFGKHREASSSCLEERGMSRCETTSDFVVGCPRCHNLMVEETFVDLQAESSGQSFMGWRCLSCGEILDPIILQNRTFRPEPPYQRARLNEGGIKVSKW